MTNTATSRAIGGLATTILFCTLLTLKVCGPLATLSWWWVTAPIWLPFALVATVGLILMTCIGLAKVVQ